MRHLKRQYNSGLMHILNKPQYINFRVIFCVILLAVTLNVTAQEHAAGAISIIYKNCTPCHRKGEAGTFPFENYKQIKDKAQLIKYIVNKGIMPPWKADTSYRHFKNERTLSKGEVFTINTWIDNGMVEEKADKKSTYKEQSLGIPDMVIKLSKPYNIKGDNKDKFITYVQKIDLKQARYLRAIEVMPGNKKLVHHCRVDFDTTDNFFKKADEFGFANTNDFNTLPLPAYSFVGDYVPGINPYIYPKNMGYKLPAKSSILINLHYSPVSKDDADQTEVRLYFYKDTLNIRPVNHYTFVLGNNDIVKTKLYIKPNIIDCFKLDIQPAPMDISVLCIQPHMHVLGKTMKIYAVSPSNTDTIPLCKIDKWDFNWQENYYFNNLVKIPKGYMLKAEACYDNTVNNPSNPNNPPKPINFVGDMVTTNEMLEFYIQTLEYVDGDEKMELVPN